MCNAGLEDPFEHYFHDSLTRSELQAFHPVSWYIFKNRDQLHVLVETGSSDTGINELIWMTKEGAPIQVLRHQQHELEGQKLNKIAVYPLSSRITELLQTYQSTPKKI